ncbi:argininosuccinate synthase domain-containing protein [Xenorhabdus khoisanae]|uniref:argininosuccinate synthase domain-containing protein n=1 Tax=Xenorhabdus khoisanae TaxID=880157 RepID=UPI0032B868DF
MENESSSIISPNEIKGTALLLYSGGLDTTYIARKIQGHNIKIILLNIMLDEDRGEDFESDLEIIYDNALEEFIADYLAVAIRNDFFVDNEYPISASISFPLIAKKAVEYASKLGASTIIHGAEVSQNAMSRFNKTIRRLNRDLFICPYAIYDTSSRKEKIKFLKKSLEENNKYAVSRDKNIWCECIENGCYDDDSYPVNNSHFMSSDEGKEKICILTLGFEKGLPKSIDKNEKSLKEIIKHIKCLSSGFSIGVYSSYEFNGLEKTRELHFSPVAAILHRAKKSLERVCLEENELEIKCFLDRKWVNEVIRGEWNSEICMAIDSFNNVITEKINGSVILKLSSGGIQILSTQRTSPKKHFLNQDYINKRLLEIKEIQ